MDPFAAGNHVAKAELGRITEDTPKYHGVIVYNMHDVPLGFGVTARSTSETQKLEPTGIVGEYLRSTSPARTSAMRRRCSDSRVKTTVLVRATAAALQTRRRRYFV